MDWNWGPTLKSIIDSVTGSEIYDSSDLELEKKKGEKIKTRNKGTQFYFSYNIGL